MDSRSHNRQALVELIRRGHIPMAARASAIALAGIHPGAAQWRHFADRALLVVGALALVAAAGFFIAYNWLELGRVGKFVLIQGALGLAVASGLILGRDALAGRISVLVAALLVGVLLAFYGQTYQTGADPWQLFFYWAVLITPWVVIARLAALWLIWLGLFNLSVVLAHAQTVHWFAMLPGRETGLYLALFVLNGVALSAAQWGAMKQRQSARWGLRVVAVACAVPVTLLACSAVLRGAVSWAWLLLWLGWFAASWAIYRQRDLLVLAGLCLSVIAVISTVAGRLLLADFNPAGLLMMALLLVGQGAAAARWLHQRYREGLS